MVDSSRLGLASPFLIDQGSGDFVGSGGSGGAGGSKKRRNELVWVALCGVVKPLFGCFLVSLEGAMIDREEFKWARRGEKLFFLSF